MPTTQYMPDGARRCWKSQDGGVHRCTLRLDHYGTCRLERQNTMDKIRLKRAPKQYKSGAPGVSGRARIERSMRSLVTQVHRFQRKDDTSPDDAAWARGVMQVLRALLGVPD